MDDMFAKLLKETAELRRKLLQANIDPDELGLRPFAITRTELHSLRATMPRMYFTHADHQKIAADMIEFNGFRFLVTDVDVSTDT